MLWKEGHVADDFRDAIRKKAGQIGTPEEDDFAAGVRKRVQPEPAFNPFRAAGEFVGGVAESVVEGVVGKTDPEFKNLEGFTGDGIADVELLSELNRLKVLTVSDAAYARGVKKILGNRFISEKKDSFDRPIITYRDDEGTVRTEFINKPGLDFEDVDRTIQSSIPFLAGAGVVGRAFQSTPLITRILAQTAGQGGVSVGQDVLAGEQVDVGKAGASAIGGGIGELSGPVISGLINVFRKAPKGALVDSAGLLTERGRKAIKDAGIEDEQITGELLDALSSADVPTSKDAAEAVFRAETDVAGIPSSRGTRAKIGEDIKLEKEAREGILGRQAQEAAFAFDKAQREGAQAAVGGTTLRLGEQGATSAPTQVQQVAPAFQQGVEAAEEAGARQITQAFDEVDIPAVFPQGIPASAFTDLEDDLVGRLTQTGFGPQTKETAEAVKLLEDFAAGRATTPAVNLTGRRAESRLLTFDEVRRQLNGFVGAARANNPTDARAAVAVKQAYNEWLEKLAGEALEIGDPEQFAKLQTAIGITAKVKAVFEERGLKDRAGKLVRRILDEADSPEGAINMLLPSTFKSPAKPGAVGAIDRLKPTLKKEQPEAWHALRQAYWLRLTRGNRALFREGPVSRRDLDTQFGQIHRNIEDALENQSSLLKALYSPDEIKQMRTVSRGIKRAQAEDPNPSGTATMGIRMLQRFKDNFLTSLLKRQAAGAQIRGEPVKAAIDRALARRAVVFFGNRGEGFAGRAMARRFSGRLTQDRRRPRNIGTGAGGFLGAELAGDEEAEAVPF